MTARIGCLEGIVSWLVSCWYWEKYWGAAHDLSEGERSTKRGVASFDGIRGGLRAFEAEERGAKLVLLVGKQLAECRKLCLC